MKFEAAAVEGMAKQHLTAPFAATYVGDVKIDSKFQAVVGIDVGTTYSGVSIAARDNPEKINCGSPGATNARDETKEPTVLLTTSEGHWYFGNEALHEYNEQVERAQDEIAEIYSDDSVAEVLRRKGVSLFRHFKMQLKNKTQGFETLTAKSTFGDPHSLLDLMTKTLEFLSKFALSEIQMGWLGALNITSQEILWVVTVPAIWNDFGKNFMRKAAYRAGLISEESSDQLLLALEPESAAIAVHGEGSSYGLFQEGSGFLVLDIGGGTVDITIHRVATAQPLVLDEISDPQGGPWGGIFVDEQFKVFLKQFFGNTLFERIERYHPVEISDLLQQFRSKKEAFKPDDKKPVKISMGGLYSDETTCDLPSLSELAERYNERPGNRYPFDLSTKKARNKMDRSFTLSISRELMLTFFEPTLSKINSLVKHLLMQYQEVSTIAVVGGYGSSPVVQKRIQSAFGGAEEDARNVIIPDGSMRPQAAVVQGAAYFGLYTQVIGNRIARYTFGVESTTKWFEGCGYPESEAEWDDKLQEKRVTNMFSVIVKKGESLSPFQKFKSKHTYSPLYPDQDTVSFRVFTSNQYCPKTTTEGGCERQGKVSIPCRNQEDEFNVYFTFGADVAVEVVRNDNERTKTTIVMDP